jgi:hypothetical protein
VYNDNVPGTCNSQPCVISEGYDTNCVTCGAGLVTGAGYQIRSLTRSRLFPRGLFSAPSGKMAANRANFQGHVFDISRTVPAEIRSQIHRAISNDTMYEDLEAHLHAFEIKE